jgi:hypothetical protein
MESRSSFAKAPADKKQKWGDGADCRLSLTAEYAEDTEGLGEKWREFTGFINSREFPP